MSPRERFMAIIEGREPDALPLLADLTYWYKARSDEGNLDARYEGDDGFLRLHEDLGCVFYYEYSDYDHAGSARLWLTSRDGCDEGSRQEGDETVCWIRTPSGELTGRKRYLPTSHTEAVTEHMVKRPEDLKLVREYMESQRYSPCFEEFVKRDAYIGERGVCMAALPQSPLAAMMVRWAGVEATCYLSVDAREEFEMTLQCIEEALDLAFDLACQSPASLFHFADNLSAENVGNFAGRYLIPYYRNRVEQLHRAGKKVVTHLDGTIRGLLGPLAATGMDAIEALTPKPVGDVALEELREEAGSDHVILWGGLPGAMLSHPYGRADVLRQVDAILKLFGTSGRFIPGTADQVPPDADIELVRAASTGLCQN